jgi:FkbM family methyltransferase
MMKQPQPQRSSVRPKSFWRKIVPQRAKSLLDPYFRFHKNNPVAGAIFTLKGCVYKAEGLSFAIPRHLTTLGFRSRFYYDIYEAAERVLIKKYIRSDDAVLELGACIGIVSVLTNLQLHDKSKHVVVEPNPELLPWLFLNRDKNKAGFAIENCLVSNGPPTAEFFIHRLIVGGSADRATERRTLVPARSLVELTERYGDFSVLVMDIEGGEVRFIAENLKDLRTTRLLLMEEHESIVGAEDIEQMHRLLRAEGFKLVDRLEQSVVWSRY